MLLQKGFYLTFHFKFHNFSFLYFWICCSKNFNTNSFNRSSHRRCSVRKGVLRKFAKFTGKHLGQSLFFNKVQAEACNFIKKETLAQVFSCEFWETSKNTFFKEHLWTTTAVSSRIGRRFNGRLMYGRCAPLSNKILHFSLFLLSKLMTYAVWSKVFL